MLEVSSLFTISKVLQVDNGVHRSSPLETVIGLKEALKLGPGTSFALSSCRAGRERGYTIQLDPSDRAIGCAQPPSPQPSPARGEGARNPFGYGF